MLKFLNSLIGLKILMAGTGVLLVLFLIVHVAGNLTLLVGADLFNQYAYTLTKNKALLYTAEAGLIAIFVLHIFTGIRLTRLNRKARPQSYAVRTNTGLSRRSWFSSNMMITGTAVLIFLVVHILDFRLGPNTMTTVEGVEMRDLAGLVAAEFGKPLKAGFYALMLFVLCGHLLHGFHSAFSTLGVEHQRFAKPLKLATKSLVVLIILGFLLILGWVYWMGVQ